MTGRTSLLFWQNVVLHSAAGIIFALVLWYSGWIRGLESYTYDLRTRIHADPTSVSPSIVLVGLDQHSLDWVAEDIGVTWRWPRQLFAAIINNCKRRGAKVVGFDVTFKDHSPSGVKDDWYLSQSISNTPFFALGAVEATNEERGALITEWPENIPKPKFKFRITNNGLKVIPKYPRASFPIPEIASEARILSNVQHQPDNDGKYRKLHPFVMFDGEPLPTLGLGMFLAANPDASVLYDKNRLIVDDRVIPLGKEGYTFINYKGPAGSYEYVSSAVLIQSEFRLDNGEISEEDIPKDMEGKYVLFGYTVSDLSPDTKTSPLGVMTGPEINATLLDNILSNDFINEVPFHATIVTLVILTFLSTFSVSIVNTFRSQASLSVLFFVLPAVIAWLTFRVGYNFTYVPVQIAVTSGIVITMFKAYFIVQGQEKFIRHSFKHYLSPVVIDQLIHNPDRLKLGGERKELTMLFSDLEGFTKISEGLDPSDLTQLLNEYLTAMTDIILDEEGTVDKFEGDAIIAFWNAPLEIEKHAEKAVRAALRCQEKLNELRPYFVKHYGKSLFMRIGINTGFAIAGNMGSSTRFDYTVLGDAVNLAARLEGANKYYGTYTMISSSTYDNLGEEFYSRELGRLRVVGRKEPVTVYEPISYRGPVKVDRDFEQGLNLFYKGEFEKALAVFSTCKSDDPAAKAYCEKCKELLGSKIDDWKGVWELSSK